MWFVDLGFEKFLGDFCFPENSRCTRVNFVSWTAQEALKVRGLFRFIWGLGDRLFCKI